MELHAPLTLLVLATLVLTAVVCDLQTRRIPNTLVGIGIALGPLFQIVALMGGDPFVNSVGASGIGAALLGGLTGLALFLPFYALRTVGAGDVKLLAMVGVWWVHNGGGPRWGFTAVCRLLVALVRACCARRWRTCTPCSSCRHALNGRRPGVAAPADHRPPAHAIACGIAVEPRRLMHQSPAP
jgi:prepilin peptidase CpaA